MTRVRALLRREPGRAREKRGRTHLGTATRMVSRYSDPLVLAKSEAETTSANDRIERLPLQVRGTESAVCAQREEDGEGGGRGRGTHVFLRSAVVTWPLTTAYCCDLFLCAFSMLATSLTSASTMSPRLRPSTRYLDRFHCHRSCALLLPSSPMRYDK